MGKQSNRKKQRRLALREASSDLPASTTIQSGLHVSVMTGLAGGRSLTLHDEIQHCKSALLYADTVTLYTLKAAFIGSMAHAATMTTDGMLELLEQVAPSLSDGAKISPEQVRNARERLANLPQRSQLTPKQKQELSGLKSQLREQLAKFQELGETQLAESGVAELEPAISSGVLVVDPIFHDDSTSSETFTDDMLTHWMDRLSEVLSAPDSYPFLDDEMTSLARHAVEEGKIGASRMVLDRQSNAGLGVGLIGRLPNFPHALMSEVLDVRRELALPLGRFRSGIHTMQTTFPSTGLDEDFGARVDDVYKLQVQPAIDEINELVKENKSLWQLVSGLTSKTSAQVGGTASVMGLCVAPQHWLISATVLASGTGLAALEAVRERNSDLQQIERGHQFYFLYEVNRRSKP
jgi:anti-sigma28 factor (negative regulator of flagellin synthesis)